jgi:hypothetical protein
MISRPIWGWFKPRDVFPIIIESHLTGLVPDARYLSVNWLMRLNASERAALHPFCIYTVGSSHITGYRMRVTYTFEDFI